MVSLTTLKMIRENSPVQDRAVAALAPTQGSETGTYHSRRVAVNIVPRTIAELRQMSGAFSEAAVAEVAWRAVGVWLMNGYPAMDKLRHPLPAARDAVIMAQGQDRHRLGWPRHDGKPSSAPALDGLTADNLRAAKIVAAETLRDWELAGCPNLDAHRVRATYLYLTSCPAFLNQHTGPNDRAIKEQH